MLGTRSRSPGQDGFNELHTEYEPKPMKQNLNIQLITATILAIGGLILLYCGAYIDPAGEIHETLLVAFGEVMTFAGSLFGIDYYYKQKGSRKS